MICRRYCYHPNFTNCCVFITKPFQHLHLIFIGTLLSSNSAFIFLLCISYLFFYLLVFDQTPPYPILHTSIAFSVHYLYAVNVG